METYYANSLASQVLKAYRVSKGSIFNSCLKAIRTGDITHVTSQLKDRDRLKRSTQPSTYEMKIISSLIDSSIRREFSNVRCLPSSTHSPEQFIPGNIVDFGGGDGIILDSLGKIYNLGVENLVLIDPKSIFSNKHTIVSSLDDIEDSCVDVILILNVLHHVRDIDEVLKEVRRVLRDDGIIIIKEHDYIVGDKLLKTFIDLVHQFWYIVNNENSDPLHLMSRQQLTDIMSQHKLIPDKEFTYNDNNPQRLYFKTYIKIF